MAHLPVHGWRERAGRSPSPSGRRANPRLLDFHKVLQLIIIDVPSLQASPPAASCEGSVVSEYGASNVVKQTRMQSTLERAGLVELLPIFEEEELTPSLLLSMGDGLQGWDLSIMQHGISKACYGRDRHHRRLE